MDSDPYNTKPKAMEEEKNFLQSKVKHRTDGINNHKSRWRSKLKKKREEAQKIQGIFG
jgi:phage-related protein